MASTLTATWTKQSTASQLQRSSHSIAVVDQTLYVFGGELKPREPRDNDIHKVDLSSGTASVTSITGSKDTSTSPSPRVGTASAVIGSKIYLFSGRGGEAMAPVEESGALWEFDTTSSSWSLITPSSKDAAVPPARSYHAMTSDGDSTIYIHAGCPESGRLSDLWAFSLSSSSWKQLASAPEAPRGGTSITFTDGKLYRFGGFDGKTEIGGKIDVYDPSSDSWSTKTFEADGKTGPGARSVAALVPVTIEGKKWLVSLFGESDPSSLGHMGAGKMLGDVWAYEIKEGKWARVQQEGGGETPAGRGWFDADVLKGKGDGKDAVVVVGGLGESNERLDDLWVLQF